MFEKKERDLFKKSDPVETSTFAQLDKEKKEFDVDILEVKKFIVKTKSYAQSYSTLQAVFIFPCRFGVQSAMVLWTPIARYFTMDGKYTTSRKARGDRWTTDNQRSTD